LLKFLPVNPNGCFLELGAFLPFTYLLKKLCLFREIEAMDLPFLGPTDSFSVEVANKGKEVERFSCKVFNVEKDHFPYSDEKFDVVLAAEIIEHLAYDPMFMLCQVNRVLKKGGFLTLTTPNICSYISVARILSGENPIGANRYCRNKNLYARHNREYTLKELESLLINSGFKISAKATLNIWAPVPESLIKMLKKNNIIINEGGECIFITTTKVSSVVQERYPKELYL